MYSNTFYEPYKQNWKIMIFSIFPYFYLEIALIKINHDLPKNWPNGQKCVGKNFREAVSSEICVVWSKFLCGRCILVGSRTPANIIIISCISAHIDEETAKKNPIFRILQTRWEILPNQRVDPIDFCWFWPFSKFGRFVFFFLL